MINRIRAFLFDNPIHNKVFKTFILVIQFLLMVSLPTCTYNRLHIIPIILGLLLSILVFFWCFLKKTLFVDASICFLIFFLLIIFFSTLINGFKTDIRAIFSCAIIFLCFYMFNKTEHTIKFLLFSLFSAIVIFSIIFAIVYRKEIISFSFEEDRIGDIFANINVNACYFAIGVCLSLYYSLTIKKKILIIVFSLLGALMLFIGATSGSKVFFLLSFFGCLTLLVVFFGKKRWYFSLIAFVIIISIAILILTLPVFSVLRNRLLSMFALFGIGSSSQFDYSTNERLSMIQEALYLFTKKPFLGYGFNGYAIQGSFGVYSHNTITELLCDFGIFGFLFFELYSFFPGLLHKTSKNSKILFSLMFVLLFLNQLTGIMFQTKYYGILITIELLCCETKQVELFKLFTPRRKQYFCVKV